MNDWRFSARAENDIAGCLLVDPEKTLREIREKVAPSDFESEHVRTIFSVVSKLIDDNKPCDVVLIQREAQEMGFPLEDSFWSQPRGRY